MSGTTLILIAALVLIFLMVWAGFTSLQNEIRNSSDRIVLAINQLELALAPEQHDDHPLYRDPDH
jgi:hypothetical protein